MAATEQERRAARAAWPVRKHGLENEPGDDLVARTTPVERLEMMWPLALDAWALAGLAIPDYRRDRTPVRVIRPESAGAPRDPAD